MKKALIIVIVFLSAMAGKAQLINSNFEQWDTNGSAGLYPRGWPSLAHNYCVQSNNAEDGSYALQISVWYYYTKSVAAQTVAVPDRSAGLSGYYMYTDNVIERMIDSKVIPDTAWVKVYATKWNSGHTQRDTIGRGVLLLDSVSAYRNFYCAINYTSGETPDSISVIINPSLATGYGSDYNSTTQTGFSSYLTLDKLSLENASGINENERPRISVYPNPVAEDLYIKSDGKEYSLSLLNTLGEMVQRQLINKEESKLDVSRLGAGIYILSMTDERGQGLTQKIVKQ